MAQQTAPEHEVPPDDAVFVLAVLAAGRAIERTLGIYAVIQGVSILLSAPSRFTAAGYRVALGLPGLAPIWGGVLFVAGMVLLAGVVHKWHRLAAVGGALVGVWSVSFSVSLAWSAVTSDAASLTGIWVHLLAGVVAFVFAVTKWQQPIVVVPRLPWRRARHIHETDQGRDGDDA